MLILLSQNEQGISALDLQKHIFPSGSSPMKNTFQWMQRHYATIAKMSNSYETNRRETSLAHPRTLLHLSVSRKGYSRNVSCAEHYLSISCVNILLI